jgi:hypothetical protein
MDERNKRSGDLELNRENERKLGSWAVRFPQLSFFLFQIHRNARFAMTRRKKLNSQLTFIASGSLGISLADLESCAV